MASNHWIRRDSNIFQQKIHIKLYRTQDRNKNYVDIQTNFH